MKIFESVAKLKLAKLTAGQLCSTKSYYATTDSDTSGAATYKILTSAQYGGTPDEYGDHTLANGNIAKLVHDGTVNVKQLGVNQSTSDAKDCIESQLNTDINKIVFDEGTYAFTTLTLTDSFAIVGAGRDKTTFTFSGTQSEDSITHSFGCNGGTSPALSDTIILEGFTCDFAGATSGIGLYVSKKVYARDVFCKNADVDGIYFRSVDQNLEAPYFCYFESVWSKSNGRSGLRITENCNQNYFVNCQFDSNADHGVHEIIILNGQPAALYGNKFESGQTSYNGKHGIYWESGSEHMAINVYQEQNSQDDGGNPKTGAYKNLKFGTSVTRSLVALGSQGTDTDIQDAIGLNTVVSNRVIQGNQQFTPFDSVSFGYENQGSGKSITFEGAAGCTHEQIYREATSNIFRTAYDGTNSAPLNQYLIEYWNGSAWEAVIEMRQNGYLGFHNSAPIAKPTITGAKGGNVALASLLTELANYGLVTDSTT